MTLVEIIKPGPLYRLNSTVAVCQSATCFFTRARARRINLLKRQGISLSTLRATAIRPCHVHNVRQQSVCLVCGHVETNISYVCLRVNRPCWPS